jgi:hypothetical protein
MYVNCTYAAHDVNPVFAFILANVNFLVRKQPFFVYTSFKIRGYIRVKPRLANLGTNEKPRLPKVCCKSETYQLRYHRANLLSKNHFLNTYEGVSKQVTNGSKTAVMDVIGFLCV